MASMTSSATISRPVDFFPVPVDQQLAAIRTVAAGLPDADVVWISESRDFAETERYTAKANVDAALVSSPAVSEERRRIEQLFSAAEPTVAAGRYLELLRQDLAALHHAFLQAIVAPPSDDLQTHRAFWQRATVLADADNAHAMYLSSDNWPFSVFHALIDELAEFVGGDHEALGPLLTAGIQDARTSVYQAFGDEYRGLDRQAFAAAVRVRDDWLRGDGVLPLFAFKAATGSTTRVPGMAGAEEISSRYRTARERVHRRLLGERRERFDAVCTWYGRLYAARAAYDTYEYFGFYAFARHLMILRTMRLVDRADPEAAGRFRYAAATYQFVEAGEYLWRLE
jgi:hypothetical protein